MNYSSFAFQQIMCKNWHTADDFENRVVRISSVNNMGVFVCVNACECACVCVSVCVCLCVSVCVCV